MIWARQRRSRPRRHTCQGKQELRPSRRNWSSWSSGRDQSGKQESYPHASLVLLWRRPPCARESLCLLARLPPWQDVAAERHALGLLHAGPYFSNISSSRPASCPIDRNRSPLFLAVYRIFRQKVEISPPAWVRQTRILLPRGRGHCPEGQAHFPSVA